MRVISQNGFYDLPYENVAISLNANNRNQVIAWSASDFCKDDLYCVMGNYSTESKAQKAMEMLREAYCGVFTSKVKRDKISLDELKTQLNEWKNQLNEAEPQIMSVSDTSHVECKYFRFSTDEDVEV